MSKEGFGIRVCGLMEVVCGICLEGLKKTTKNLSQSSQCSCHDLNQAPSECEVGIAATPDYLVRSI
jgi:hypothetical protein